MNVEKTKVLIACETALKSVEVRRKYAFERAVEDKMSGILFRILYKKDRRKKAEEIVKSEFPPVSISGMVDFYSHWSVIGYEVEDQANKLMKLAEISYGEIMELTQDQTLFVHRWVKTWEEGKELTSKPTCCRLAAK